MARTLGDPGGPWRAAVPTLVMLAEAAARLRPVAAQAHALLGWWLGELHGMLPGGLRSRLKMGRDDLVLAVRPRVCHLERRGRTATDLLAEWFCGDASDAATESPLEPELPPAIAAARSGCRVVLELPGAGQTLVRDLTLPMAAAENLRAVLGYEMDRHTPFSASQLFFGARVLERRAATAQIRVRLVATPRRVLESWLTRMERWGLYPDRVQVAGEPEIDLMPADHRRRSRPWLGVNTTLYGLVLLLVALLVFTPLWILRDVNRAVHAEIRLLQPQAAEVQRLRERRDQLEVERVRLLRQVTEYPPVTTTLGELATVLPDDTWVSTLQYSGQRIVVQGQAAGAAGLISRIESSPYFTESRFAAPVSRDRAGIESFQIQIGLVPSSEVVTEREAVPGGNRSAEGGTTP